MPNISDIIESYLKSLFESSSHDFIEIQRNELAIRFNCVPSQINYVLTTRFTIGNGFIIESRRGGGGYVRIVKIPLRKSSHLVDVLHLLGESISQWDAERVVNRLYEEELLTEREAYIMLAALDSKVLNIDPSLKDRLRVGILKAMLAQVLRINRFGERGE